MLSLARVPSILLLGVIYVAYVLIGGVAFWKLEGDFGSKDLSMVLSSKDKLLTTYTCLNQDALAAVAQVRRRNVVYLLIYLCDTCAIMRPRTSLCLSLNLLNIFLN